MQKSLSKHVKLHLVIGLCFYDVCRIPNFDQLKFCIRIFK